MAGLSDIILFAHPTFGVLAILAALWVFVEALNASVRNLTRLRYASVVAAVCMIGAWLLGGYWYVTFYAPEKAAILRGPWPFAHDLFMETKEHLFFIPLILALYLPLVARLDLSRDRRARSMTLFVAALVVGYGLAIEGAGAVVNHGVKLAFIRSGPHGHE